MEHFNSLQGWLQWQESLHPKVIDLGLDRVERVYRELNPEAVKPLTITVAGTNGKGSCIAFLEKIYRAQGYRVGSYTSPHILKYNERIRIDGVCVADELICQVFERIESIRDNISLSYFEFGTLTALEIFRHAQLDVQLLEVGLGGRLDAVNIIDADVALITSICIDHCDWLGETREAIGKEKAGIIRQGMPAIIGDADPPESLLQAAEEKSAQLYCFNHDFTYQKADTGWYWVAENNYLYDLPAPGLKGEHQFRNASAVLMAVDVMMKQLPVSDHSLRMGLSTASLTGRYQLIEDTVPVLLDVGHNPQAVRALALYLQETFPGRKIHAIFSMMKDKDIKGVIEIINPLVVAWFVSPIRNPRTASTQMMREAFTACGVENVGYDYSDFSETFTAARVNVTKDDLILVFGSFFLVSAYLSGLALTYDGD